MIDLNKTGAELIAEERENHIKIGFDEKRDDSLVDGQLLYLAQYCIFSNDVNLPKRGWDLDYLRQLHLKDRLEQLVIAGSLIAAEIDRRKRILLKELEELQKAQENENSESEE